MEKSEILDTGSQQTVKKTIAVSLIVLYNAAIIVSQIYTQIQLTSLQDKYDGGFEVFDRKLEDCAKEVKNLQQQLLQTMKSREVDFSDLVSSVVLSVEDFSPTELDRNKREVLSSGKIDLASLLRGRDGRDGKDGAVGPPGVPGRDGLPGHHGVQGPPGIAGKDGFPGKDGKDAVNLAFVNHIINTTVTKMVSTEMEKVKIQAKNIPSVSGATYIRWGRTVCPSGSDLIYKGKAGGTYYIQTGGSPEFLCMPEDPEYFAHSGSVNTYISGVEYQVGSSAHSKQITGYAQNAPCILCQAQHRSTATTFPAKLQCPDSSWTKEYSGFIMTSSRGHQKTNYMCVDKDAEAVPGMGADEEGGLLYYVGVQCGTGTSSGNLGHCPPYKQDSPVTCTVCTK